MKAIFRFFSLLPFIFRFALSLVPGSAIAGLSLDQYFQSESRFLPVDEAFILTSSNSDRGITLRWQIAPGYYLYQDRIKIQTPENQPPASSLIFNNLPEDKEDPSFGLVKVYHNELSAFQPIGSEITQPINLTLTYQGCAEAGLCYPPQKKTLSFTPAASGSDNNIPLPKSLSLTSAQSTTPDTETDTKTDTESSAGIFEFLKHSNLATICGLFFLMGVGLTFTPCVFPMIPILSSIIAGQKHITHSHAFVLSLGYVIGMATTYAAAGVVTGLLGASANIQALLQTPYVLVAFSLLFVVLSLSMFGVYELQLPAFIRDKLDQTSHKVSGGKLASVTLMGAISALVVSPCVSAPMAGALIYISTTGNALIGGLSLFSMGLGMGVPLILVGMGGNRLLPKAGYWMNEVKIFFGALLLGVAVWIIERLIPATTTLLLWAILAGFYAIHLGAFEPAKPGSERIKKAFAFFLALYSAMLFTGAISGANDALSPLAPFTQAKAQAPIDTRTTENTKIIVRTAEEFDKSIALGTQTNRPLVVDFYADWCISCKVMEKNIFSDRGVQKLMENTLFVQVDVTQNDAQNIGLLKRFGLFGPPGILFFNQDGSEDTNLRAVGEIEKEDFVRRIEKLTSRNKMAGVPLG
ncbi:MAG: protein-disulfide reductase DsbD [Hahellaceae bacterium]|nr:protein-disulfide reductase DsbD [Hahellaceae bacterium]